MLPLKPIFFSVATGLTVIAFAGFAANTTPKTVVLAKDASFSLPSPQGQLKGINTRLIAQKQPRVALVIGNANYEEGALSNPVNDATDMAKALRELDFEVTLLQNQDLRSMETAINDFSRQLRKGGVGVFYYAGHGVQVEGENYLIPLKAQLLNEKDARYEAVALGKVLNAMEEARNQVNIIIIDACRDNPFYRRWRSSRRSSNVRGLTAVSPATGIIIAYATREGNTAADGVGQRNSPFTSALLENIKKPNIDVQLMFRRVSTSVKEKTNAAQQPWTEGDLEGGEFYLNPQQSVAVSPSPFSPPPITPSPVVTPQPTPPTQPRSTLISSTTGVDYAPLRQLLQQKKWKEADDITFKLMLASAKYQNPDWKNRDWLDEKDINSFACEDLKFIDRLWSEYSNNQLGLSAQLKFWNDAKNNSTTIIEAYRQFAQWVQWILPSSTSSGSSYISSDDIKYANPPQGHLPVQITYPLGEGWSDGGSNTNRHLLYSRFADCRKKGN
ncbi:MAG: peptidase C14 [Microcystis sp. Msp_OC_L_20101000_S702]|uniref:caspase family protein n=1 Tax=Microcystis sp. Msp_OC_L_20101000_S702 TaxID=2486218 RepID=UPI001197B269|nr:caspase family protein [Microcystis sp. Msp_OC_L_20101000_S702]TRU06325.1 MAG: peptidase C14 [Microcystis sp. Msp_OC_L_20101000_S702]